MPVAGVIGASGADKTSVAATLKKLGGRALDADKEPGLARWIDLEGTLVTRPDHPSHAWLVRNRWTWDLACLDELVAQAGSEWLVPCGNASNEVEFFERIDRVILLEIDLTTMLQRLDNETRDNEFGTWATAAICCSAGFPAIRSARAGSGPRSSTPPLRETSLLTRSCQH